VTLQIIRGNPRLSRWGGVHDFLSTILCTLYAYSFNDASKQPKAFLQNFKIVLNCMCLKITKKAPPHTTASFYKSQRQVSEPCRPIEIPNPGGKAIRTLRRLRRLDVGCIAITAAGLSGGASVAHASEVRSAVTCLSVKV
jgi:hypothetical protein